MVPTLLSLAGSEFNFTLVWEPQLILGSCGRLDRLTQTAKELTETTGRACIPVQADVRQPQTLHDAVAKTLEKFGRIDFVICGKPHWNTFLFHLLMFVKVLPETS